MSLPMNNKDKNVKNYIDWEDMIIDENVQPVPKQRYIFLWNRRIPIPSWLPTPKSSRIITIKNPLNASRVIVVDKNGKGYSLTVQGAIDMVPSSNSQRVKITIKNHLNASRVIVVDKSGKGDSLTVQGAIDMVPSSNSQRVKIFIRPGIYREKVIVPKTKPYISFIGNESHAKDTIISWGAKASDRYKNGRTINTAGSASVLIESDFFCATAITFENTAKIKLGDDGRQAVALRLVGDKAMLYKIRVLGSQATLYDDSGSHYFYQCYIEGDIDFIFGKAKSIYKACDIRSTAKSYGAIAAHHRDIENEDTGFSFLNCNISGTGKVFLGRAWGNYSRIIYSHCSIDDIIEPVGWSDCGDSYKQRQVTFGEYNCSGRGAIREGRAPWSKKLTIDEVKPFLGKEFIAGDQWLRLYIISRYRSVPIC